MLKGRKLVVEDKQSIRDGHRLYVVETPLDETNPDGVWEPWTFDENGTFGFRDACIELIASELTTEPLRWLISTTDAVSKEIADQGFVIRRATTGDRVEQITSSPTIWSSHGTAVVTSETEYVMEDTDDES